jgi:hypothetical protein
MTTEHTITVAEAIALLRSGAQLGNRVISDLATSRIKAMDALLLAEHGIVVPDGNIVYDDRDIQYDPDFDEMEWGKPFSFQEKKEQLEKIASGEELVVRLQIKDDRMKEWLDNNRTKLDLIINKLLEDFYKTEQLLKE